MILWALRKFGYVVLKATNYEMLQRLASCAPRTMPIAITHVSTAHDATSLKELDSRQHGLPAMQYEELSAALHKLSSNQIPGDIVDCGSGSTRTLSAISTILLSINDTGRKLVKLDISGDPTLNTENELSLWGGITDLLNMPDQGRRLEPAITTVPKLFVASEYPAEKLVLIRDPLLRQVRSGIPEKIAFLSITSDTYPANREAIKLLFNRVVSGGMIAVENIRGTQNNRDAVDEFLIGQNIQLSFKKISTTFRIGIKPDTSAA